MLDVNKMTELVPLLDALEEGVTLIGAENYSTGSTVLPFLVKFNKLLKKDETDLGYICLLYTSPSPRDQRGSRMPSSA